MEIQRIEIYKWNGKEYRKLKDIKTEIENNVGNIIDKVSPMLLPKQKLNLLQVIVNNKEELIKNLSVTIDMSDNFQSDFKNILDISL